jgi:non-ribosomal peptide synthetase-like protein
MVSSLSSAMNRPQLLHDVFARTARRYPRNIAVRSVVESRTRKYSALTYAQLHVRASRFARYLRGKGVVPGDRVLLYLPRGLDAYMVLLGVLQAGAAYVPVDWSHPVERAVYIADEADVRLVVTAGERRNAFSHAGRQAIGLEAELGDVAACEPLDENSTITPEHLAYVIYTSGSTGRPKGVMIRHANIVFQIDSEKRILGLTPRDIVYAGASLAFDMSVEEMWAAFRTGATLLVGTESLAKSPGELPALFRDHGVTVWCPVPSLLAVVDEPLPSLRLINAGGEACPPELVRRWAPGRRMINTYGPTETTVSATWAELSAGAPVTIGKALPGFSVHVVDEDLQPVTKGAAGELLIGGPGVGAGYWNDPELTARKFVHPPFAPGERMYRSGDKVRVDAQGDLEFLGRIDLQVKIRGYRVELGEIETVLLEDPAVAQAAVRLFDDPDGSQLLAAFLAPRAGRTVRVTALKARAEERLPAYMRPHAYVLRDSLPTIISGKVDRRALDRPADVVPQERAVEPPSTALEADLLEIWKGLFAPAAISVTDDFFEDLGGHSLRAAQMVSRARARGIEALAIRDLYAAPTIRALARRLSADRPTQAKAEPFHAVPASRYRLCVLAQGAASLLVFALAGLQWALPYLIYTVVVTAEPQSRLTGLLAAAAAFVAVPPLLIAFSITFKWAVIGRFKPGDYPLWGAYYFRWWLVRRVLSIVPTNFLAGTPMLAVYFRLLGARIGANAFIRTNDIDAPDLVQIGRGAIIGRGAAIATTCVEQGLLRVGHCHIGEGASVGVMAVVGQNTRVGAGAMLEDMSALPAGGIIPPGEHWGGSPAARRKPREQPPAAPLPKPVRRVLVTLGLAVAAALLPLAAVLPIAPGLIGLIELDWATTGYGYIALSPALALTYVVGTCLFIVATKWLLLGRVREGTRPLWSWFYIRFWFTQQLGELALDLLRPIYATLYVKPWYRALGARVGPRAEISTAMAVVHDLVEIGPESFIADGVVFGDDKVEPNRIRLGPVRIGRRSFIGNSALVPTGSTVGDDVLIGVLSRPPEDPAQAREPGSTWFGLPPIRLPHRQIAVQFDEGARFHPSKRLLAQRLAMEYVRVTLPMTGFIVMFAFLLSVAGDLSDLPHGAWWVFGLFPFLYIGLAIGVGLFAAAVKWLVVGRYKPITAPLWSMFVWRTELVTSLYENLMAPLLLDPLRGTPFINMALRLMGCRIGRRVFTDTTDLTEFDLVNVGDDAALNEGSGLQTHLFEDRVMKVSRVAIGARAVVGSRAIVLYDTVMEPESHIGDLSVLMKGETLPARTVWEGSPAKPAQRPDAECKPDTGSFRRLGSRLHAKT